MRNTDKKKLDENAINKLIIIQTNYLKRAVILKNAGKQFSVEL
jgi:hypothetical protein